MNPLRFTRRNLLRGGLAATATIPLLDARMARRSDDDVPHAPRRVRDAQRHAQQPVLADGHARPTSRSTRSRPTSTPYKSKLTFLKGIKLNPALQNGALGGTVGSEHARGTGGMLTGRPLKSGTQFKSFGNTTSGWGSGQSLDQYLVGKLAPNTTFPSLQLGVHVRDTEVRARISYAGADMPIPPREDPKDVFAALFGMTTGDGRRPIRRWRGCGRSARACSTRPTPRPTRIKGLVGKSRQRQAGRAPGRDARRREAAGRHDRHRHGAAAASPAPSRRARGRRPEERRPLPAGRAGADGPGGGGAGLRPDAHPHVPVVVLGERAPVRVPRTSAATTTPSRTTSRRAAPTTTPTTRSRSGTSSSSRTCWARWTRIKEGDRTLLDNSIVLWATEIGESTQHDLTA